MSTHSYVKTYVKNISLEEYYTISSLKYNMKSLEISNKIGNSKGLVTSLTNISKIYLSQGKLIIAKEYALKAFKIAKEIGQPDKLKTAAEICSDIYKKQGEGMKALDMFKLHIQMRDSINNKENQKVSISKKTRQVPSTH